MKLGKTDAAVRTATGKNGFNDLIIHHGDTEATEKE